MSDTSPHARELVSVIVPTYNDDRVRLSKTLHSIARQTHRPLDIIVVDDGSAVPFASLTEEDFSDCCTDPSSERSIRFVNPGRHVGLAGAKNIGIRLARGGYVSFLDCGDWWHAEKISEQISCIMKASDACGLVYCGIQVVEVSREHERKLYDVHPLVRGSSLEPLLLINNRITGSNSAVMIRRGVFDAVGYFYEDEDIPEDIDLWARIAAGYSVEYVDRILAYIEKSPHSMSSDPEKKSISYLRYYQMRKPQIDKYGLWDKAMSQYYSVIGRKLFLRRRIGRGLYFFALAARHEVNIRVLSRFMISVAEGVFGTYVLTKYLYSLQRACSRSSRFRDS